MGQQLSVCHVSTLAANVRFESQAGVCDVASNLLEPGSGRMAQKAKRQALGGGLPFENLPISTLLTRTVLDHLLNLGLYSFKIERSRSLHWRKLDRRLRQLSDVLLDHHEPPELSGEKVVHVSTAQMVQTLAAN